MRAKPDSKNLMSKISAIYMRVQVYEQETTDISCLHPNAYDTTDGVSRGENPLGSNRTKRTCTSETAESVL